jgi:N-acetylmuramoyl-L-alanine amidase
LYVLDRWTTHQKGLKVLSPKKIAITETKKGDVEYKLKTLEPSSNTSVNAANDDKSGSFFTVVLDPTHGGDDAGSIGYKSAVESNLNLQFAFKLARALRMRGVKVYLTRMDDVNVPVDTRFNEAVKRSPNMFLSINCSYSDIRSLRGMELYGFTPIQGQEDDSKIENIKNRFYDKYEGSYVTKAQGAMVVENRVSLAIKEGLDLPYRSGLERKFFKFMAMPANVPTLGIFIGYISNAEDVERLENEKYIDDITERLAASIENGLLKKL